MITMHGERHNVYQTGLVSLGFFILLLRFSFVPTICNLALILLQLVLRLTLWIVSFIYGDVDCSLFQDLFVTILMESLFLFLDNMGRCINDDET